MVSSSKAIDPQKLPPTERAAFYQFEGSFTGDALEEAHTRRLEIGSGALGLEAG